ncbi:LacI family transcriptional regulator [Thiospirochaeta perfilievii]|uniref:LacI family transcriptional regulator n=1 Tax=Thiospirochaeta perfilievii TaxID=252967 RepID=A0A5C1QDY9_9SPIO|nr:LacI family DNA-binding transcriptional regulator [Thiospirochaeta perfilievii]QEN05199.1 LacI family transcriptional regulator [Thiospirochaeta perfilievii]
MSITIRDVANKAGVSPATVSLVLNNKIGVGEKTRKIVFEAVDSLGYNIPKVKKTSKSKGVVRFLKIAKHGHIINRDHSVFISDYTDGIEKEAKEFGYGLEIRNYNSFDINEIISELDNSTVSGMVVLATELKSEDIPLFDKINIPIVFIDASHPYSHFDFVDMDNEGAVFSIVSAFKELGHKKIGLVKSSFETRNFKHREKSFYDALAYFGLEQNKSWEYSVDSTFKKSYMDMKTQLEEGRELPTALFCVCDIISFGCMKALKEKGLDIPNDISIIGFDDLPSCLLSDPPLSSIKVSKTRIGRRAFQLLNRRLQSSEDLPYEKVYIGRELIKRDSLGEVKL